jgi:hypothetical protein
MSTNDPITIGGHRSIPQETSVVSETTPSTAKEPYLGHSVSTTRDNKHLAAIMKKTAEQQQEQSATVQKPVESHNVNCNQEINKAIANALGSISKKTEVEPSTGSTIESPATPREKVRPSLVSMFKTSWEGFKMLVKMNQDIKPPTINIDKVINKVAEEAKGVAASFARAALWVNLNNLRPQEIMEKADLINAMFDLFPQRDDLERGIVNGYRVEIEFVPELCNILKTLQDKESSTEQIDQSKNKLQEIYLKHLQHQPETEEITDQQIFSSKQVFANITDETRGARAAADKLNNRDLDRNVLAESLELVLKERGKLFRQFLMDAKKHL